MALENGGDRERQVAVEKENGLKSVLESSLVLLEFPEFGLLRSKAADLKFI